MSKVKDWEEAKLMIDFQCSLEAGKNVLSSSTTEMRFQMGDSDELSTENDKVICSASVLNF